MVAKLNKVKTITNKKTFESKTNHPHPQVNKFELTSGGGGVPK